MKARMTLGIVLLASSTTIAIAQPGGGRQGGPPDPEQFIARMMQRDANGDGKLSRDELPGQFAERMFETGDANGDGFLDKEELQKAFESFRQQREAGGGRGFGGERPGAGAPGEPGVRPNAGGGMGAALSFDDGMQMAGRAMRQLRRSQFNDDSRLADLRLIQQVQAGLITSKGRVAEVEMAPQAKEKYADDEFMYHSDMRLSLIQTLFESLALEDAVIRGDAAEAKKSLENMMALQKEGHAAFQDEEDEDDAPAPEPTRVRPSEG